MRSFALNLMYQQYGELDYLKQLAREQIAFCQNLYRKDLISHYGCVNTVNFSNDGELLVSGGDDRRVLLWNCNEITYLENPKPTCMKTNHLSNIFSAAFDFEKLHILSSGNDEKVLRHNIETQVCLNTYSFDEPVYSVDMPNGDSCIFVTAGEDGMIQLCDVRASNSRKRIAYSAGSFHGVAFHPIEQRLIGSANSLDGVCLWDTRFPEKPLIQYCSKYPVTKSVGAMSVRFSYTGDKIVALQRKHGPVIYQLDGSSSVEYFHPNYSNTCTMKSACFAGDKDQFIVSGSDDFYLYIWKVVEENDDSCKTGHVVLSGHRSIVNQVRYNRFHHILLSSGVEKVIKVWSPFEMKACSGDLTGDDVCITRQKYSHSDYMRLLVQTGEMSHDYESENTEEDCKTLAFFDSLVERTKKDFQDDVSDSDDSDRATQVLDLLLDGGEFNPISAVVNSDTSDEENDGNGDNDGESHRDNDNRNFGISIGDLRRLFRSDYTNTTRTSREHSDTTHRVVNSGSSEEMSSTTVHTVNIGNNENQSSADEAEEQRRSDDVSVEFRKNNFDVKKRRYRKR